MANTAKNTETPIVDAVKKEKPVAQLMPNSDCFQQAEYVFTGYVATVLKGTTKKEIEAPEFWAHVAQKLRIYDTIIVRSEDGAFYAKYLVVNCSRTWAKVKELFFYPLTDEDLVTSEGDELVDGYLVTFKGPSKKWCVIRASDGATVDDHLETRADAISKREDHLRVLEA